MKMRLLLCLGMTFVFNAISVNAGELVLHAPETSDDGSYILKLEAIGSSDFDQLELYRSIDGSEFKLLATVPYFKAISQLVNRNGLYGYKIRGVHASVATDFSQPVFVRVQSRSMQLQQKVEKLVPADPELALGI